MECILRAYRKQPIPAYLFGSNQTLDAEQGRRPLADIRKSTSDEEVDREMRLVGAQSGGTKKKSGPTLLWTSRLLIVMMPETQHGVGGTSRAICERELRDPADRLEMTICGEEGRKEGARHRRDEPHGVGRGRGFSLVGSGRLCQFCRRKELPCIVCLCAKRIICCMLTYQ